MNRDQIIKWFKNQYEFTIVSTYNGSVHEIRLGNYKFAALCSFDNLCFYNLRLIKNAQIEVCDSGYYEFKDVTENLLNYRMAKFKKLIQDLTELTKKETVDIKLKALRKEFEE